MRLRLDPTSPSGVSVEPEAPKADRRQSNGYVVNNATGLITAGTNVTISGNGTQSSPYKINSSGSGGTGGAVDSVNGQTGAVVLTADDISDTGTTNQFVTATDVTTLSNTSGTNTGDQTLSITGSSLTISGSNGNTVTLPTGSGTGGGTVTSVAVSGADGIAVSGSPVTDSGTIDLSLGDITPTTVSADTVTASGANGNLKLSADTDGGEFNLSSDASGTLAVYGSAANTLNLNLLDGGLQTNSTTRLTNAGVAENTDFTGTGNTFPTFNQDTTGNAATATKLQTSRTIQANLGSTTATSFDGSANITPGITGTLGVANGGTGRATATTAYGLIAAGTTAAGVQQTVSPGTSGQILKSNGAAALATFQTGAAGDVGLGNVTNDAQLKIASNLSDLNSASTARTNLGLGTIATLAAPSGTVVGTTDTQTLTNKTLTTPKVDSLKDTTNGTTVVAFTGSASAVNSININNSTTGDLPYINATGTDTNITLGLTGKGSGAVRVNSTNGLEFLGSSGSAGTAGPGMGKIYANGASNSRPHWINDGGTDETILTDYTTTSFSASISSNFTTTSTSAVQVTSFTKTFTAVGGRPYKVTAFAPGLYNSVATNNTKMTVWQGTVGTGTQIAYGYGMQGGSSATSGLAMGVITPSAGSVTINVGLSVSAGTGTLEAATTGKAYLIIEPI